MKKARFMLFVITVLFLGVLTGVFIGRKLGTVPVSIYSSNTAGSDTVSISKQTEATRPGLININTADVHQLSMLPGIGETLAQRIIDYREHNGAFDSIEDLMQVEGIGEKRLETITAYITTGG